METLNHPITAAITLAAFLWLSYAAMHPKPVPYDVQGLNKLVDSLNHSSRNQAIMNIWNLTDADVAAPVRLFGE